MPGQQRADGLAGLDTVALPHDRVDRLDRHEQRSRPDRDERPIDDDPGEVHDAARRRAHRHPARGRSEVGPAVAGAVGGRGSEEGPQDDARPLDGPRPCPGAARRVPARHQERGEDAGEQRAHGGRVARERASGPLHRAPVDDRAPVRAVGER